MKMWHGVVVVASLATTVGLTEVTGDLDVSPPREMIRDEPAPQVRYIHLLPVRWRGDRYGYDKIKTLADVERQLKEPVFHSDTFSLTMEMAPFRNGEFNKEQVIEVTTCYGEAVALAKGYAQLPNGWYGEDTSMRFQLRQTALFQLRELKPSRESYVDSFVLARDALSHLPKHWFTNRTWEAEGLDRLNAGIEIVPEDEYDWGFYLKYRNPWDITLYTVGDPEGDEFVEKEAGYWFDTQVLAWGDANGDGIEDLVVEFWHGWMGNHAYGWGKIVVLTRFDEHDRLVEVDLP